MYFPDPLSGRPLSNIPPLATSYALLVAERLTIPWMSSLGLPGRYCAGDNIQTVTVGSNLFAWVS